MDCTPQYALSIKKRDGLYATFTNFSAVDGVNFYSSGITSGTPLTPSTPLTAKLMVTNNIPGPVDFELDFLYTTPESKIAAPVRVSANPGYDAIYFNSEFLCTGNWTLKRSLQRNFPGQKSVAAYSLANPPLPLPTFPSGTEFDDPPETGVPKY